MKRAVLIKEREKNGWTQKQVAGFLGISLRYYQAVEYGSRKGNIELWDKIEDLFQVRQRDLRK